MSAKPPRALKGIRILSLALNLPGPAALMRCRQMGATCVKLEPPSGDPMGLYARVAYDQLHEGVRILKGDLKAEAGRRLLMRELARADVLLTSFRPSALDKLGLSWRALHRQFPALSQVAIVGAPGERAEEPGHDLTYLAEHGLVPGMELPATLYADMGGSLMASEAVLQAAMRAREPYSGSGDANRKGIYLEVPLSSAAAYLGLPRSWGLTTPKGAVGGAHAGYRIYPCKDGRVAVAALEPHFAAALCNAAGVPPSGERALLMSTATRETIAAFLLTQTRKQLDWLAVQKDIPLLTMA